MAEGKLEAFEVVPDGAGRRRRIASELSLSLRLHRPRGAEPSPCLRAVEEAVLCGRSLGRLPRGAPWTRGLACRAGAPKTPMGEVLAYHGGVCAARFSFELGGFRVEVVRPPCKLWASSKSGRDSHGGVRGALRDRTANRASRTRRSEGPGRRLSPPNKHGHTNTAGRASASRPLLARTRRKVAPADPPAAFASRARGLSRSRRAWAVSRRVRGGSRPLMITSRPFYTSVNN